MKDSSFARMVKGTMPKQFVDNHKVGDVFIIYYRVRSTRELQDKENKFKALVGRPIVQETWFGGITDAIDLQRAHAAILIDFAGASTDTHLSGQRFDLVVDEQGEVDADDWYIRDIPIDPTINILKWARVGQIDHTPADTTPLQLKVRVWAKIQQSFERFLQDNGTSKWSSVVNCQTFARDCIESLPGNHSWPLDFPVCANPWIVDLYVAAHNTSTKINRSQEIKEPQEEV